MTEIQLRGLMCEVGRRLWQRGLVGAAEGNLSVRLSPRQFLCTPTGLSKGHLKPDDLVVIDTTGAVVRGPDPSVETRLHLHIYKRRADCQAIVHAHPPVATATALAGEDIPDNVLPEAAMVLGSVAIVPFAMPGTDEVPNAIDPLLDDHKTFLMSHHGALAMGKDLLDAYNRMETLERVSNVLMLARMMGGARAMPASAFDRMLETALNGEL